MDNGIVVFADMYNSVSWCYLKYIKVCLNM